MMAEVVVVVVAEVVAQATSRMAGTEAPGALASRCTKVEQRRPSPGSTAKVPSFGVWQGVKGHWQG